jgi:SAM-dependent methyltransferase
MIAEQSVPTCPVCLGIDTWEFIQLLQVPVHCNVLWPTSEGALEAPRGDMTLGFCRTCGHLWNSRFDPSVMEYTQAYENSLHFSPRFREYAEQLAGRLVEQYRLRGKTVIDIGCGKGDFLAMLCQRGENRGYGFDPSYEPGIQSVDAEARMTIIQDFYSPKYASYQADLISCRHVLEHIQFPRIFLDNVLQAVGGRAETVVFFEVPNGLWTLRDLGIWDLIYEHCSYFTPSSLRRACSESGFNVHGLEELYGGQFLGIDLTLGRVPSTGSAGREKDAARVDGLVEAFAARYHDKVRQWREHFAQIRRAGNTVVVWGGGSKGVTFLNTLGLREEVAALVDINPRKQQHFVPGTAQQVVGPEALKEIRPDEVIIVNAIYEEEISHHLSALGLKAKILVA